MVCFGDVALLSGEDAEKAMENNPKYVTGEETLFSITSENARKIVFEGKEEDLEILNTYFDASSAYIIFDDTAQVKAVPDATVDPEGAFFYNNCNGKQLALIKALSGDEYLYESPLDKTDVTSHLRGLGKTARGEGPFKVLCQAVGDFEADVVARVVVLGTDVSQTGNQVFHFVKLVVISSLE